MTWTHGFSEQSLGNLWAWRSAPVSKLSSMGIHSSCVSHPTSPQLQDFLSGNRSKPDQRDHQHQEGAKKTILIAKSTCGINNWIHFLWYWNQVRYCTATKWQPPPEAVCFKRSDWCSITTSEGTTKNTMVGTTKNTKWDTICQVIQSDLFIP